MKKAYGVYYNFIISNGNGNRNFCSGNKEWCKCRC